MTGMDGSAAVPTVESLGHDGLAITGANGVAAWIDAWRAPAFDGTWLPLAGDHPAPSSVPAAAIVTQPTPDHFDAATLASLPADVPILLPRYADDTLIDLVRHRLPGRPIEIMEPWTWHPLGAGHCWEAIAIPEATARLAAAILLRPRGVAGDVPYAWLHLGETKLSLMQARLVHTLVGPVAGMSTRATTATAEPILCTTDEEERARRLKQAQRDRIESILGTRRTVAAPVVYLAQASVRIADTVPEAAWINEQLDAARPTVAEQIIETLRNRKATVEPMPVGTPIPLPVDGAAFDGAPAERVEAPAQVESSAGVAAWEGSLGPAWDRMRVHIVVETEGGETLFAGGASPTGDPNLYDRMTIRVPEDRAAAIRDGSASMAEIVRSFHASIRTGATYRRAVQALAVFDTGWPHPDRATRRMAARTEAAKWIVVPQPEGGGVATVGRYCPHAEVDMQAAGEWLATGHVRCHAHGYDFDTQTGLCVDADDCKPLPIAPDRRAGR